MPIRVGFSRIHGDDRFNRSYTGFVNLVCEIDDKRGAVLGPFCFVGNGDDRLMQALLVELRDDPQLLCIQSHVTMDGIDADFCDECRQDSLIELAVLRFLIQALKGLMGRERTVSTESGEQFIVSIHDHEDARAVAGKLSAGFFGIAAVIKVRVVIRNEMEDGRLNLPLSLQQKDCAAGMGLYVVLIGLGEAGSRMSVTDNRGSNL